MNIGDIIMQPGCMPEDDPELARRKAAELLRLSPEALDAFEKSYALNVLDRDIDTGNLMDAKRPVTEKTDGLTTGAEMSKKLEDIENRIVHELLGQTEYIEWNGRRLKTGHFEPPRDILDKPVTAEDIRSLPETARPQLTGSLVSKQIKGDSYPDVLWFYGMHLHAESSETKKHAYHMFRQGLDILDLDPVLYNMLGMNPNAIGKWLPALCFAIMDQKAPFFRIPETRVIRVPLPLLQLSRLDYESLTPATLRILDKYCMTAFALDDSRDYFVKTGTYSSKFDFRNARVAAGKETHELGEYLLYISHQAVRMAGPLSTPSIYGVSTTNEWAVREYIAPDANTPTIYKGLPLRPEYRAFIDLEAGSVIGMSPYWRPDIMEKRFAGEQDADSPHQVHDYLAFKAAEPGLMRAYDRNKDTMRAGIEELIPYLKRSGLDTIGRQWSIDIMQQGSEFYIIDMALAASSALSECVPAGLLKAENENWLPELGTPGHDKRMKGRNNMQINENCATCPLYETCWDEGANPGGACLKNKSGQEDEGE